jgi:tRNA G18 (ribose-2'-O)-methylase SpoU
MGISNNFEINLKKIADLYHCHLKEAKMNLKEHNLLPSIRRKDGTPKEAFLENAIYLDNIRSAYNVGSIIRTTEALRIGSLYFSEKTPFTDNKKVIKTSMGASTLVPCFQNYPLEKLPSPIIALETSDDAINIFEFIFPEKFTVILGNEEYGISDESLKKADYIIEIPVFGAKNSINVASAYSILAAQIKRQKIHL